MFWNRKQMQEGEERLPGPKGIPGPVESYMVVKMEKDPDWVWRVGLRTAMRNVCTDIIARGVLTNKCCKPHRGERS